MATDTEKELLADVGRIQSGFERPLKDARWDIGSMNRTLKVGSEHPESHAALIANAEKTFGVMTGIAKALDGDVEKFEKVKKPTTSDFATLRAKAEDAKIRFDAAFEALRKDKQILETETYGNIRQSA